MGPQEPQERLEDNRTIQEVPPIQLTEYGLS